MNAIFLRKACLLSGVFLLCLLVIGNSTLARQKDNPPPPQLLITSVQVDFESGLITINGSNFANGDYPTVTLGEYDLSVDECYDDKIVAIVPEGVSAGDYLLTVSTGPAVKDNDAYCLTIGAVSRDSVEALKSSICPLYKELGMVVEAPAFCLVSEKQGTTVTYMTEIAMANEGYYEEFNDYAPSLVALEDWVGGGCFPTTDGWGNAFVYQYSPQSYTLISLGSDGVEGPAPPDPWLLGEAGESDIIMEKGWFIQRPVEPEEN